MTSFLLFTAMVRLMRMNTKEDLLTLDVKRNLFLAIDLSVKPPKRLFFEDAVEMIMALSKMKFKWIHIPSTTQDILVRTLRNRNDLNSLSNEVSFVAFTLIQ
jgi:hypothetical protein